MTAVTDIYIIIMIQKFLYRGITTWIWFRCMKKSLMEDKRNKKVQRTHTHQNPKRHFSLVSLLLGRKIAAVQCFVWHLGLRTW